MAILAAVNHPTTSGHRTSVFECSGIASLDDLKSVTWQATYGFLEETQKTFLDLEAKFRSQDYSRKWPSDALHTWSRVWEYPFVYWHLSRHLIRGQEMPLVADFGSGVTFFPFAIARLGYRVICVDNDPICREDLMKATQWFSAQPGRVEFELSNDATMPFGDNTLDALYCISVLEHVSCPARFISEFARVLKPGGICLITLDLDLKGNAAIGVEGHSQIVTAISDAFDALYPDISIHPSKVLTSDNSPFPQRRPSAFEIARFALQENVLKRLIGKVSRPIPTRTQLAVQAFVLVKNNRQSQAGTGRVELGGVSDSHSE